MIVIGYQGIGKSTICKDNPRHIDFESSALKMFGRRPHKIEKVIAWRPLPEPYKAESEEV